MIKVIIQIKIATHLCHVCLQCLSDSDVAAEVSRVALRLIVDTANTRWLESVDICPSGFPFGPWQNLKSCSLHVHTNVNKCQRNATDLEVKTSSADASVCVAVTAEHLHVWLQSTSTCLGFSLTVELPVKLNYCIWTTERTSNDLTGGQWLFASSNEDRTASFMTDYFSPSLTVIQRWWVKWVLSVM